MSRIRRTDLSTVDTLKLSAFWRIAIYIRLSRDDGNDESLSVVNQRKIILEFIEEKFSNEEYAVIDFYVDDGRSGTTEDTRPDFQRMVADIANGKVNCVICKTLSRCFRNYSDQGRFLEQFLPIHRCRFIAISNPFVDTFKDPDCTQNMEIPINGLMNDRYAAKTSADVRRTFNSKRKRGEFIGAAAPYGYQKNPDNKNVLLVDEDAAQIVRNIYRKFVYEGVGKCGIAKYLNSIGVPNPTAYKKSKGIHYGSSHSEENDGMWSAKTVRDILMNQVYTGAMVQGRQTIISYKVHKRVSVEPENWYVVEGTHEAIIEKDLFDAAQELNRRDMRTAPGKHNVYLFSGFLRCADCKKAFIRCSSKNYVYYVCRTYREKGRDKCTRHAIRHDVLEKAVLVAIQKQIELVATLAETVEEINAAPVAVLKSNRLQCLMQQKRLELEKTTSLLDGLYLDMKCGDISREQYHRMKDRFEKQTEQLQREMVQLQKECDAFSQGVDAGDPYLDAFLKYRNIQTLERGLLVELVKYIYIHEDGAIEIVFKFADQYQRILDFIENNPLNLSANKKPAS